MQCFGVLLLFNVLDDVIHIKKLFALVNDETLLEPIDAAALHRRARVTTLHDDWTVIEQRYATWHHMVNATIFVN